MALSEPMIGGTQACEQSRVTHDTDRTSSPIFRRPGFGLAARLALYTAILGTVVTAVLTSYMYQGSVDALITGELHELAATNQAGGLRFSTRIAFAREDALILARLPEVIAVARTQHSAGVDPAAGSGADQARARLATTFRTLLEGRPGYIQLRYIAADGREAVRTERLPNGEIETAPRQALRDLADRPYFKDAKALPQGDVYVSDVGLNQPNGTIEQPRRSIVRVASPTYDPAGGLLGVVVVNVDLRELFAPRHPVGPPAIASLRHRPQRRISVSAGCTGGIHRCRQRIGPDPGRPAAACAAVRAWRFGLFRHRQHGRPAIRHRRPPHLLRSPPARPLSGAGDAVAAVARRRRDCGAQEPHPAGGRRAARLRRRRRRLACRWRWCGRCAR